VTRRFDAAYYRRHYLDPKTRVYSKARHARLVAGVVSMVEWFGGSVSTVLDVGAGLGWWGAWLRRHRPGTTVVSTELDPDICRRHGHLQADLTRWRLDQRFDLVVCQGVLPYLDAPGAEAALESLAAMCGGFLYLEAITREDVGRAIDAERTDLSVAVRPAAFYRKRLRPHFRELGGGLFAARWAELPFYALEARD
jgi:SAM-dependent methyltransferase